jgi:Xaa-Pro aminopeptidase
VITGPGIIPRPSLAERDRRHHAIREAMAKQGIDVLVLSANTTRWAQMMADSRYVTAIGGFESEVLTIVPREGEITAYIYNRAAWWKRNVDWVSDVRDGRNDWGTNVVERVKELKMEKGTIGFAGLSGLARAPSGTITWGTVDAVTKAFPQAKIVNATALMQDVRTEKSAEEVEFMQRSMDIIEKMIEVMVRMAKPGAVEKEIYGQMVATLLANDGELPSFLLFGTGPNLTGSSFMQTSRVLAKSDRIINEIEAKFGGYAAQAVQPVAIGKASDNYQNMIALSKVCFDEVLAAMKPGATFGSLMDIYTDIVKREGNGKWGTGIPMMHARGMGDDGPALLRKSDLDTFRNIPLREGMTFILKPRVSEIEGKERASVGDTVTVTKTGARRLGKRQMGLITVDC